MDEKILRLINKFYDDPAVISKNFGGPENFIRFILSRSEDYIDEIDPSLQFFYDEEMQDMVIWEQYQASKDKQKFIRNFAKKFLDSDIDIDGDKIIWVTSIDDVPNLFDDRGNYGTAKGVAKEIFGEDGFNEWFTDVITNFYDDCVTSLNNENNQRLSNKIVSDLPPLTKDDIEQTSFLEELWEIEGQPETLKITEDNINSLLEDEETTKYIMSNFFPELESDMANAYWNAYNSAYEDELSKSVYSGMDDLLGDSGTMVNRGKNNYGKDVWRYHIDITSVFEDMFKKYFSDWKNHYHQIEYFGSFSQMLEVLFDTGDVDRIDFRIPDYPDFDDVVSVYNEIVEIY